LTFINTTPQDVGIKSVNKDITPIRTPTKPQNGCDPR